MIICWEDDLSSDFPIPRMVFQDVITTLDIPLIVHPATSKKDPRFRMADAKKFAAEHRLQKEAKLILSMKVHQFFKRQREVRKGCFVELFEAHGIMEEFVSQYWPVRNTDAGEQRRKLYLDQKVLNERLLKGEGHRPDLRGRKEVSV
jgi:hypothetical protein